MRNPIPNILIGIASILCILAIWIFWPKDLDSGMVYESSDSSEALLPDYLMHKFRYASVKDGLREMEIYSDQAQMLLENKQAKGSAILAYFYNLNGEVTKLVGKRGTFDMEARHLRVIEDVESRSPDGFTMRGNVADYFVNTQLLVTPEPVYGFTEKEDIKIWANRAESKMNSSEGKFTGDVRTEYIAPKEGLMKIRSDWALLDRKGNSVTYYDHVKMNQKKMDMTSGEASLYYTEMNGKKKSGQGERKSVKYLVARKDVAIQEAEARTSQSQVAEFFADTNSIVLTGFPSVYDGKNTITGDRLTLFRNSGVVEVTSANAAFSEQLKHEKRGTTKLSGDDLELVVEDKDKK